MDIRTIYEENLYEYSDYIDRDVTENMVRLYYRGIAAHDPDDDDLLSLLIWELKYMEDDKDTESELKWIYAADPSFISPLLDGYRTEALSEDVRRTFFECSPPEKERDAALGDSGFSLETTESKTVSVTVDECNELPIAKKKAPSYVQNIASLNNQEFYQGLMNILFKYDNPALEDFSYRPREWYEQSVSCYTKTDGKVTGFFLVHKCPSGILVPVLLFSVGADSRLNLIEMMRFSIQQAVEIYPGNTVIHIYRRNPEVNALSGKLFPDKKGEPAVTGERIEEG
jgi:hypothetical protein